MDAATGRILVVDDDPQVNRTISRILSVKGYLVDTSKSRVDAFEMLQHVKYDLVILDIMMPGITAKSLIEKIKENADAENLKDIKIMYVSAVDFTSEQIEKMCWEDGVVGYVRKPFDSQMLVDKVAEAMK